MVSIALLAVIGLAAAEPDGKAVNDSRMTSYEDSSTQRNLTDKGRGRA